MLHRTFLSSVATRTKCQYSNRNATLLLLDGVKDLISLKLRSQMSYNKVSMMIHRCHLNTIMTQVCLELTIGHFKMCSFINTMPRMSKVLRECAIGMPAAGTSTRAVAHELNEHV